VANGIKFSDDLRRNLVVRMQMESAGQMLITVTDDGVGVRPEFESSLFNMYARDERTSVVPGTGLGLSICRKLAADMDGASVAYKPREDGLGNFLFILCLCKLVCSRTARIVFLFTFRCLCKGRRCATSGIEAQ
jgi:K+-sensing histidine kinase KdpD